MTVFVRAVSCTENAAGSVSTMLGAEQVSWYRRARRLGPYERYLDVDHQLCCAHALRELAGVAEITTAGQADWCWATQIAEALVAMQKLVAHAITTGADTVDPDALTTQIQRYRCAA